MKQIESTLAVAASVAVGVLVVVAIAVRLPSTPRAPVVDPAGTTQLAAPAQPTATDVDPTLGAPTIATSELARRVKMGQIKSIEVVDQHAIVTSQDVQQQFVVNVSPDTSLADVLEQFGVTPDQLASVDYEVLEAPFGGNLGRFLFVLLSLIVGVIVLVVVWEGRRVSSNGYTAFAKNTARVWEGGRQPGVRFADVAGVGEAIQELEEVVEFLRDPEKFSALGARIPKGVLLIGPPGTGKTLLARAVAGEAGVPFFSIAGSAFVEMFVGVGASRVRDLFAQAKKRAPCIVFVDEIDAVGRQRGTGHGSDEREQTLNQVLVEMDGFDPSANVIVIGATNRPDVLDPALIRPGRFDRRVVLSAPDSAGRNAILRVHARGKPFDAGVDFSTLARVTPGLSGAELANVINEAAILAVRCDKQVISMPELEEAIDRVTAGVQQQSRVMSDREKRLTAYHEAGHAVFGDFLPNHAPPYAISIVSRRRIGGSTRFVPAEDRRYMTRSQLNDMLASALGGLAAELAVFHELSTSAGDDIQRATNIARRMITRFGMSERLGPVGLGAEAIDDEIRWLIDEARARAMSIITEHRELLGRLALELVRKESLDGIDLERIFQGDGPAICPLSSCSQEAAA